MPLLPIHTLPWRALRRVRREVASARDRRATRGFRAQAERLAQGRGAEYGAYLTTQLDRSLGRRANDPGVGQRLLVEAAAQGAPRATHVLCIGCRNGRELDLFRAHGATDVIGIDIFSQREDIIVMDMHELAFGDGSFDVVYSAHSLEHALDPQRVAAEIMRVVRPGGIVAVEVPVRHRGSAADRVVFAGIDQLDELFGAGRGETLLREEQPARTPRNDQGSEIARLVFRAAKTAASPTSAKAG